MLERRIPSSGTPVPVIGLGTWLGFDVSEAPDVARLRSVITALTRGGGRVIDSSPMYGRAEKVVGDLIASSGLPRDDFFLATKIWTRGRDAGIASVDTSMRLMGTERLDLVQVHNLLDLDVHMATLRRLKDEGRVTHVGITHYTNEAHSALEAAMIRYRPDTVQLNYSAADRAAELRLLPLAADLGIAVVVNVPFGSGRILRQNGRRAVPPVAAELDVTSWGALLLKFVLAHPSVTVAIPGTGSPDHMAANARAADGPLPDGEQRAAIVAAISP